MTQYPTCFKYFVLGFDNRIKDVIENKAHIAVFADSEQEALEKAAKMISRKSYEVVEVTEVIDVFEAK